MIPIYLVKNKIDRLRTEIQAEKNMKSKELLEERILVLEELLSETVLIDIFEDKI